MKNIHSRQLHDEFHERTRVATPKIVELLKPIMDQLPINAKHSRDRLIQLYCEMLSVIDSGNQNFKAQANVFFSLLGFNFIKAFSNESVDVFNKLDNGFLYDFACECAIASVPDPVPTAKSPRQLRDAWKKFLETSFGTS